VVVDQTLARRKVIIYCLQQTRAAHTLVKTTEKVLEDLDMDPYAVESYERTDNIERNPSGDIVVEIVTSKAVRRQSNAIAAYL